MPKTNETEKEDKGLALEVNTTEIADGSQGAVDTTEIADGNEKFKTSDEPKKPETKGSTGDFVIVAKQFAGITMSGAYGQIIFDDKGEAKVGEQEYNRLLTIPGFEAKK